VFLPTPPPIKNYRRGETVSPEDIKLVKDGLSENYPGKTGMIFGEIYRKDGKWKFNAIGQATDDRGIVSSPEIG
jgi:stress response protein SCP2